MESYLIIGQSYLILSVNRYNCARLERAVRENALAKSCTGIATRLGIEQLAYLWHISKKGEGISTGREPKPLIESKPRAMQHKGSW